MFFRRLTFLLSSLGPYALGAIWNTFTKDAFGPGPALDCSPLQKCFKFKKRSLRHQEHFI